MSDQCGARARSPFINTLARPDARFCPSVVLTTTPLRATHADAPVNANMVARLSTTRSEPSAIPAVSRVSKTRRSRREASAAALR